MSNLPTGIREVQNVIVTEKNVLPKLPKKPHAVEKFVDCERDYFQRLLHACQGNICAAVQMSGIGRSTIYRKIADYGIKRYN